jgi:putative ABC transport system substrate-binding protein
MQPRLATLIDTLALGNCLAPSALNARPPARVARIGFLATALPAAIAGFLEAFRQGLRELGYVEGQTLAIEARWAEGRAERLPALAAELIRLKVDLIVAAGTEATRVAKRATSSIPIVMAVSGEAVGTGLAPSLARPGGNVTGQTVISPELSGKRLQLLTEVRPGITRVAVLWNPADPPRLLEFKETQAAARTLGVALQPVEVRAPEEFDRAFAAITEGRPRALIAFNDPLTRSHLQSIVAFAARHRLLATYGSREYVDAGGLMSYGPSFPDLFRRAATYVDKILKGAKPANLPVEQPARFELVMNLKTAKALGLAFPQSILLQATEVIQ